MSEAPRTMPEFIKTWERKLDKIIASHGVADQADDIKQDIYIAMCERNETGKTGLERYDPALGSFSTYAYRLILLKVQNARAKKIKENHYVPLSHDTLVEDDDNFNSWTRDRLEKRAADLLGEIRDDVRAEFWAHVASMRKSLRTYPVRSDFFRNGECITRDLGTLFDLIREGKSREEIVEYFEYSTGSVGVLFEQLRNAEEIIELRQILSEAG